MAVAFFNRRSLTFKTATSRRYRSRPLRVLRSRIAPRFATTVVAFNLDPAPPTGRYDVVFDTAGTMPFATARRMLKPGGRIIDIIPSAVKFARSILPGPYTAFMGRPNSNDLQHIADTAGRGEIATHVARTISLADAIPALIELERDHNSSA